MDFLMGIRVAGTGMYVPSTILDNKYFENHGPYLIYLGEEPDGEPIWEIDKESGKIKEETITAEKIESLSGIKQRRKSSKRESVLELAKEALTCALENAELDVEELEAIICASVTQAYRSGSLACMLQDQIGAKNVEYARDVSAGCAGFVHALSDLRAVMQLDGKSPVAVIGAETLTRCTDRDRNCILFGDGAGCVIFETTDEPEYENFVVVYDSQATGGKSKSLFIDQSGMIRMPNNREVFKLGVEQMVNIAAKAKLEYAKRCNLPLKEVDQLVKLYIPHQANIRMIDMISKKIGNEKVFANIEQYGNTSAATIPIALHEAISLNRLKRGELVVTPAFGAGFAIACALFRV